MIAVRTLKITTALVAALALSGCGVFRSGPASPDSSGAGSEIINRNPVEESDSIWDLFKRDNNETTVAVNKYLWSASLEVLDFLPLQTVDPFTGVIVTGYGTPPNGGRAYRATILIDDPALDARSLNVALQTRNGRPASAATIRAVEDAILSRARQLRIQDNKF